MRINFVLSSLFLSGGVQVVIEYANHLAARGHHITLIAPRNTCDLEMAQLISPAVIVRESYAPLQQCGGVLPQVRLTLSLARAIPSGDMIIATHTPTIVPVLLKTLFCHKRRAWLYMDYAEMFESRPIESWLLRYGPRWFDRIAALSEAGREDALRSGARNAIAVGLGITAEQLFVPQTRATNLRNVAMYLGDVRPRKGLTEFLAAAEIVQRRIPDLQLLIVTKDRPSFETFVPFEHVVKPARSALPDLYRRADVFVSASWSEGFGLPPLEAMACGVPVVLTDSGGVRDYARPGENCLMVPPRDVEQLAAAMIRLLSDQVYAQKLGQAGAATTPRFQWDACVDRLETMLRA